MFDDVGPRSRREVIARFDALAQEALQRWQQRTATAESVDWLDQITTAVRIENQAVAAQLAAIGGLFRYRLAQSSCETQNWAVDTMAAVAAEVAAGLRISQGLATDRVHAARAMRERLPQTAEVFLAGDIDYRAFSTIVSRTELILDAEALTRADALIAANVARWPSLTRGRLAAKVDAIVAGVDADAVRRRQERQLEREIWIGADADGISQITGSLFSVDAHALDQRLNALAATVCAHDPRTTKERRADAMGALAAGADRLGCRCGRTDCAAGKRPAAAPVTIHVIASQDTLTGGQAPGSEFRADALITPELIAELAKSAKLVPLVHPGYAPPEPGYRPSKALADFVRARDLTCRWPGCDVPATHCQLDHTIPYADGGPTHAGNMKCYCPTHHLLKTFWGWREKQLPDGTLILTSPAGQTHVTTPGSALLFPSLCYAVGGMPAPQTDPPPENYCADRSAMMPKRRRTRTQDRTHRVATERQHNRQARLAAQPGPAPPNDEPPPF